MAVDTAEKRKAVAGIPYWPLSPGVTPNASPGAEWRYEVAWSYGGLESVVSAMGLPVQKYGERLEKIMQRERTTHYLTPESHTLKRGPQ